MSRQQTTRSFSTPSIINRLREMEETKPELWNSNRFFPDREQDDSENPLKEAAIVLNTELPKHLIKLWNRGKMI